MLERIVEIEQNLVMTDPNDSSFKKLFSQVDTILQNPDIEHLDKIRLVLLTIISHEGINDSDRQRFLEMAKFKTPPGTSWTMSMLTGNSCESVRLLGSAC